MTRQRAMGKLRVNLGKVDAMPHRDCGLKDSPFSWLGTLNVKQKTVKIAGWEDTLCLTGITE